MKNQVIRQMNGTYSFELDGQMVEFQPHYRRDESEPLEFEMWWTPGLLESNQKSPYLDEVRKNVENFKKLAQHPCAHPTEFTYPDFVDRHAKGDISLTVRFRESEFGDLLRYEVSEFSVKVVPMLKISSTVMADAGATVRTYLTSTVKEYDLKMGEVLLNSKSSKIEVTVGAVMLELFGLGNTDRAEVAIRQAGLWGTIESLVLQIVLKMEKAVSRSKNRDYVGPAAKSAKTRGAKKARADFADAVKRALKFGVPDEEIQNIVELAMIEHTLGS